MNFQGATEYIEQSEEYKEYSEKNKDNYLVHGFILVENNKKTPWQIGYYSKKTSKISVFNAEEKITKNPEEEAFRKKGHVEKLHLKKISFSLDTVLEKVEEIRQKYYSSEIVQKTIVILQTLEKISTWNITLITHTFSMINIKINSETGEIISKEKSSILNLGNKV